tara:strand:- start:13 stop:459 length:447 start_codon:yes stop_codon:yes gene_type:complete
MSKKLSYKGKIPIGEQDRIRLKTLKGKVGYRITKFQLFPNAPHATNTALVSKIFKSNQSASVSPTVDFTDSDLIAVAAYEDNSNDARQQHDTIVFDNEVVNQDIFITMDDADSNTTPGNYYIELETMPLSDLETTMLTLKNLRTIASQ